MSLNVLGMLCEILLGLGIMMDIDVLKSASQCPRLIHALTIFMMLLRHDKFFIISLRCLQDSLSDIRVESLLYLWMDDKNSTLRKVATW